MGMVLGRTGVAEPVAVQTWQRGEYIIRTYAPMVYATTSSPETSPGFRRLAGYIGVGGRPNNARSEGMAMTAPVIMTGPSDAATEMSFVMLGAASPGDLPAPNDGTVRLEQKPGKTVAVREFSGWVKPEVAQKEHDTLAAALAADGVEVTSEAWVCCQYVKRALLPLLLLRVVLCSLRLLRHALCYCYHSPLLRLTLSGTIRRSQSRSSGATRYGSTWRRRSRSRVRRGVK